MKRKSVTAAFIIGCLLCLVPLNLYGAGSGFNYFKDYLAYGFYFLVVFLAMFLLVKYIVKWRSKKLEREKQRLDQIVEERTRELNEKNRQLEQQTHQLEEQSEKLKELDEIKSRFFANISHEFRTPLTLIMGPLEQMRANSCDPEQQKQFDIMLQNSQRLLTLINQLLGLSQIDSGKMKLQARRQDIISFLEGISTTFEVLARHNRLDLEFYSKEEEIVLYFDTEKLEEVMTNLLINAIQFTPTEGKIMVSAAIARDKREDGSLSPGVVEISVQDTGTGIPGDQLSHIFDRFYQAEHSIAGERVYTATGIGLALTKELVELHHGDIRVESTEGQGTRFIIRLPMGKEHLETHEIINVPETPSEPRKPDEVSAAYMIEKGDEESESPEEAKGIPGKETDESQEKYIVLVVDDNSIFRKYLRECLKPFYTVLEAVDGNDGMNKAKERIPDLIISDVMMPGRDGYELCKVLKEDIKTSHIPIILLTAKASEGNIIQGLGTGADDYITKPYTTSILIARIKNLIQQRRQQRKKPGTPPDDAFFKELHEIIEQDLANPDFNEDQLCRKLHMTQPTLLRKIDAMTGETPNQYIQSYRLERAAQLLKNNFGGVAEVAYAVGFTSTAEFARCFKEKFKQLPTAFQEPGVSSKSSPGTGTTEES